MDLGPYIPCSVPSARPIALTVLTGRVHWNCWRAGSPSTRTVARTVAIAISGFATRSPIQGRAAMANGRSRRPATPWRGNANGASSSSMASEFCAFWLFSTTSPASTAAADPPRAAERPAVTPRYAEGIAPDHGNRRLRPVLKPFRSVAAAAARPATEAAQRTLRKIRSAIMASTAGAAWPTPRLATGGARTRSSTT